MMVFVTRIAVFAALLLGLSGIAARAGDELVMVRPESLGGAAEKTLTIAELRALPQHELLVDTEWYEGTQSFTGPLARDVIQVIGQGTGTIAHLVAINDYAIDVPFSDFETYDVIFALDQNGEPMSPRDKGPIWVMYPLNDHAELRDPETNGKLLWQLVRLEVR